FLILRGRRTQANLAEAVAAEQRATSNMSRFFSAHADEVVEGYSRAARRLIARCVLAARRGKGKKDKRWTLLVDTTFQRKHALRMPNLIKYKENSKGVAAQSHAFVVAVLIAPSGVRIPLPVLDFYSRPYIAAFNKDRQGHDRLVFRSQVDLCCELVRTTRSWLPSDFELLVAADSFFEGAKLDSTCEALHKTYYITPLDTARVAAADEGNLTAFTVTDAARNMTIAGGFGGGVAAQNNQFQVTVSGNGTAASTAIDDSLVDALISATNASPTAPAVLVPPPANGPPLNTNTGDTITTANLVDVVGATTDTITATVVNQGQDANGNFVGGTGDSTSLDAGLGSGVVADGGLGGASGLPDEPKRR
ncbi:MAG: hypothetical protein ACYCW6_32070, partial [Candidatus Xenobia bacterium]